MYLTGDFWAEHVCHTHGATTRWERQGK